MHKRGVGIDYLNWKSHATVARDRTSSILAVRVEASDLLSIWLYPNL